MPGRSEALANAGEVERAHRAETAAHRGKEVHGPPALGYLNIHNSNCEIYPLDSDKQCLKMCHLGAADADYLTTLLAQHLYSLPFKI